MNLLNELVARISFRMSVLYPQSPTRIRQETRRLLVKRGCLGAGIILFFVMFSRDVYWVAISILLVAVVGFVYEASVYNRLRVRMLGQLEEFLNQLVFNYRYSRSIEEAMFDTVASSPYDIGLHGSFMQELLDRDDYEETLEYYASVCPDSYFLMFFSLCHIVKNEGDSEEADGSMFIDSINLLIEDINEDLTRHTRLANAFTGLLPVSVMPVFFMKPMELWAMANVDGLGDYYRGTAGVLGTLAVAAMSIIVFWMVGRMQYPYVMQRRKSRLVELLTYGAGDDSAYGAMVEGLQNHFINRNYGKYKRLSVILRQACCELNVREFKVKQALYGVAGGVLCLLLSSGLCMGALPRVGLVLAGAFLGYWLPIVIIAFSQATVRNDIANEVIRLQSAVWMCVKQDGVDVPVILSHMEMVAVHFKEPIIKALDGYDGSGLEALETLRDEAYDKTFARLVDGLIACDELSVPDAFANIGMERKYNIRKRRMTEEKLIQDRGALARFVAFIPMMSSIVLKLILPFIMEGMNELLALTSELQF